MTASFFISAVLLLLFKFKYGIVLKMYLDLPIAAVTIFVPYFLGIAFFVGGISGLLGISGGFILTPFMIALGVPASIAVGTSSVQIFAASFHAVVTYYRNKTIPYRAAFSLIGGGVLGVALGVMIFRYLSVYYNLDIIIRYSFVILLLSVACLLFVPPPQDHKHLNLNALTRLDMVKLSSVGVVIGILSGILGIGGGFLIIPALIYFLSVDSKQAVVLSQTNIVCVSLLSFIMHAVINHNIDYVLAIILVVGGVLGSSVGLWFHHKLSRKTSRYIFITIVVVTACILIYDLCVH